jgi:hypothetical protein
LEGLTKPRSLFQNSEENEQQNKEKERMLCGRHRHQATYKNLTYITCAVQSGNLICQILILAGQLTNFKREGIEENAGNLTDCVLQSGLELR